jgi:hypothetical protein
MRMIARQRCIACLVLYHLILGTLFLVWGKAVPSTHWSGSLLAFGLPTVQFTWGFTVGLMLGPHRRYRRWWWASLLFSPVPLSFVYIATMLAYHFVGIDLAFLCVVFGLAVIIAETIAGVIVGMDAHTRFRTS